MEKDTPTLDELERECRENSGGQLSHPCSPASLERVFGAAARESVVPWARLRDFQRISLRMIASELVALSPLYRNQPHLLEGGLFIPGERKCARFRQPVRLLYSGANRGAKAVAEELQRAAAELQPGLPFGLTEDPDAPPPPTHFLLYLNRGSFVSEGGKSQDAVESDGPRHNQPASTISNQPAGSTATMVRWALQQGDEVRIVLVHEQDPARGGCAFRRFFEVTPRDVIRAKLYSTLAIPLYPTHEHRAVSTINILRALGASDQAATTTPRSPKSSHGGVVGKLRRGDTIGSQAMRLLAGLSRRIRSSRPLVAQVGEESHRLELADLSFSEKQRGGIVPVGGGSPTRPSGKSEASKRTSKSSV